MPTEAEKQAEKERVTRISGFRVSAHDFLPRWTLMLLRLEMTDGRPNIAISLAKSESMRSYAE